MLTIQDIEDAHITYIKSLSLGFHVAATPDDPGQFKALGTKGCVLVRFQGDGSLIPPAIPPIGQPYQQREMSYGIMVGSRSLRTPSAQKKATSIYNCVQGIADAYRGWLMPDPDLTEQLNKEKGMRWWVKKILFIGEREKVWWYVIEITCNYTR